ncbi:MAG TPA: tetratricopeptide repeat protein [Candidatus Limnocylindrales bacterium]|nr:tetratricopeptide repeat protein [Candidatus Limnocylindrales bacterium]
MATQLARAHGLEGRYDDALLVLEVQPTEDPEMNVRVLLERGRVVNMQGDPAGARALFESAFQAATESGFDQLAIDALHMVAIVVPPEEQDALNRRALELAASSDDPRARQWRASLLNNIGWTAFDAGRYDEALSEFEEALDARREHGKTADIQVARWCVARTLRALGRVDEALTIQLSLAEEHAAAGTADPFVDEEIAACRAALDLKPERHHSPEGRDHFSAR